VHFVGLFLSSVWSVSVFVLGSTVHFDSCFKYFSNIIWNLPKVTQCSVISLKILFFFVVISLCQIIEFIWIVLLSPLSEGSCWLWDKFIVLSGKWDKGSLNHRSGAYQESPGSILKQFCGICVGKDGSEQGISEYFGIFLSVPIHWCSELHAIMYNGDTRS